MGATLVWTVPDSRVDGSYLDPADISHYELTLDGVFRQEVNPKWTKVRVYRNGHYRIRAVTVDGVDGEYSREVYVGKDGGYDEFGAAAEAPEAGAE